ncbi:type II toxin-antitoxin system death-on-curing family toxin [Aliidiomarina quisquiliarum]|uniref:type II toxin-antitoxin system death-on-curing family toxin n=1 Tax=Aliidiomarina quisquiliarum TaxID=2938947 RepID=UPI00208EC902|nr:type II toxin-antitoxin system death-on-curing family toxin [Aliidiomarina quisquiliarum]MCO4320969.1 type II toxin-antitoxin system death-on-curing family toxin [Aliidiomarina quisquiliarum]
MNLVRFPSSRVVEINAFILANGPGNKGAPDKGLLQGALARIDNAIVYDGLCDVFEIAAKYAKVIAQAHAMSDANKRTGLMVALEYLALNNYEIKKPYEPFADAMVDLVLGNLSELGFADLLYAAYSESSL